MVYVPFDCNNRIVKATFVPCSQVGKGNKYLTTKDSIWRCSFPTINGMMKLLEKYYNINYYCAYKLLFFLCSRLLNPLYWLSLLKWDNRYIKWLVSIGKKIEEGGMNKGVDVYISDMALSTPITISCWIFSLVCLACIKIFKVELSSIWEIPFEKYIIILISLLVIIGICAYYVNKIFLFKHDKYRKYFAEFDKKKRYLLYYGIYVVSLVVRWATFYLLLMEIVKWYLP